MRVVMHGESKVTIAGRGRGLNSVFARAQQLHNRKRQIGEMNRVGNLAPREKIGERTRIGCPRQLLAERVRDFNDTRPLFRCAHYSAQRHYPSSFEELRHRHIRGDHEVFDKVAGAVEFRHSKICNLARIV